jgi:hypothetical protein
VFLLDMVDTANFAKKKEDKRVTLRDRIVGTTNAGKAFRVGALASGAGLAALAHNKRGALKNMANNPKDFFSRPTEVEINTNGRKKQGRGFVGSGRNVNWNRVGKTTGIATTALAIPTGAAYLSGEKKDKEDIQKRVNNTTRGIRSVARDVRGWVNTIHRISR